MNFEAMLSMVEYLNDEYAGTFSWTDEHGYKHGDVSAERAHRRRGERPCLDCRRASAIYGQKRRAS